MNIVLLIGAVVIIALSGFFIRSKQQSKKKQETVESYVSTIFSSQSYYPEVSSGFTYGVPSFTLKFKTDEEKQHAISNGLTEKFVEKIQEQHSDLRPHGEAFDAKQAVAIYSTEDEKRWAKEAENYRSDDN